MDEGGGETERETDVGLSKRSNAGSEIKTVTS